MSEKYYVVSDNELVNLCVASRNFAYNYEEVDKWLIRLRLSEAACRAREVPEWATHFVAITEYVPRHGAYVLSNHKEIKR